MPGLYRVAIDSGTPKSGRGRGRGQSRGRSANHECSMCDKTFTSEVFLKAHEQSHLKAGEDTDGPRKVQQAGVSLPDISRLVLFRYCLTVLVFVCV